MAPQPQPSPNPTHPQPGGGSPLEIDTGGLHSKPEVDYGNEPIAPSQPEPETVPLPEREEPGPGPETDPGH